MTTIKTKPILIKKIKFQLNIVFEKKHINIAWNYEYWII